MDTKLFEEYKLSLYEEVYRTDRPGQSVVINTLDETLYMKKELTVYNTGVYEWIMQHPDPRLAAVREYFPGEDCLIVIEEYIHGQTLEKYLSEQMPEEQERFRILWQILDGIGYLHKAPVPVIHRDIKASNIMVTGEGGVKIIDYNAAKFYEPGETKDTVLIGTYGSAAPEQFGFAGSDRRTDIYALGKLIEEMFPGDVRLQPVVEKATRIDPERRYRNVEELREAVREILDRDRLSAWPVLGAAVFFIFDIWLYRILFLPMYSSELQAQVSRLVLLAGGLFLLSVFGRWRPVCRLIRLMKSEKTAVRAAGSLFAAAVVTSVWAFAMGAVCMLP